MTAYWKKAQTAALKAKLQGEIALIDREGKAHRRAVGIELYDLLEEHQRQRHYSSSSTTTSTATASSTPSSFLGWVSSSSFWGRPAQQQLIHDTFMGAQLEVRTFQDEHDAKEQEVLKLQADRERAMGSAGSTASDQFHRAGEWVSSQSKEAKLKTEMALLERKIRQRKEQFGLDVFAFLVEDPSSAGTTTSTSSTTTTDSNPHSGGGGFLGTVKAGITNAVSKLHPTEQKIQQCIERALSEDAAVESRKARKEREIQRLEQSLLDSHA